MWAVGNQVFIAIAPFGVAPHDLAVPVLGILLSSKTLATSVASLSFTFPGEERVHVVLGLHEKVASLTLSLVCIT